MEKVINEFKVIETDDGFRIELKGDKDTIRQMWGNFGPRAHRGRRHKFGHGFGAHFGHMCGHNECCAEEPEQEEAEAQAAN